MRRAWNGAMPVTVASGSGNATINFKWDGKNVSGAVCGDMEITQDVSGGVKPASYPVSGSLILTATAKEILAQPKFPLIKINLKVAPSDESWGAVQKILDDKEGVCGYVVDKVNILKIVEGLINKGFNVRLPTEKIKPMAVPVGIEPSMKVQGRQVDLAIKLGELDSWWDLLDPKYRGKLVMTDPDSAGNIGNWRFIYYSPDLGPKFITRLLTETQVTFGANEHQMMDWVGSGKYFLHVLAKLENTENARKQGLPVRQIFSDKEGDTISTGSGHIVTFKNAPHPNATKVYLNWFLSRDGQLAWQKLTGRNSFRTDIPKDMIRYKDEQVPKEGGKYLLSSLPQYEDVKPLRQLVDDVLAKAKQK